MADPATNQALLRCLEAVRPAGLSTNEWLRRAGVNSSFVTALRRGTEPSVYKIERLASVAGLRLSDFWKMVEESRE